MAENSRFFGSAEGDIRQYNQTEFAEVLERFFENGYFPDMGGKLEVKPTDPPKMAVTILTGGGWLQGYFYKNDSDLELTIRNADTTNDRIDRVVLRLDTVNARLITAHVLQGTPSASPVPPALTRNDQVYEISLAQVRVNAGVSSVSASNITDERGDKEVCGEAVPRGGGGPTDELQQEIDWLKVEVGDLRTEVEELRTEVDGFSTEIESIREGIVPSAKGYGNSGDVSVNIPGITSYYDGLLVEVYIPETSSSPYYQYSLRINNLGYRQIRSYPYEAQASTEIFPGKYYLLRYDAKSNYFITTRYSSILAGGNYRFYINNSTGNDSGTGVSSSTAFRTFRPIASFIHGKIVNSLNITVERTGNTYDFTDLTSVDSIVNTLVINGNNSVTRPMVSSTYIGEQGLRVGYLRMTNLSFPGHRIGLHNCSFLLQNLEITGSGWDEGINVYRSNGAVDTISTSDRKTLVNAYEGSLVTVNNCSGSTSGTMAYARDSLIIFKGNSLSGSNPTFARAGHVIT